MGWRCGRRVRLCILGPSRDEQCDDYRRHSLDQMTTLTVWHRCRIPHAAEACEVNGLALPSVRAPAMPRSPLPGPTAPASGHRTGRLTVSHDTRT